mgnify:CR=1 FL=1
MRRIKNGTKVRLSFAFDFDLCSLRAFARSNSIPKFPALSFGSLYFDGTFGFKHCVKTSRKQRNKRHLRKYDNQRHNRHKIRKHKITIDVDVSGQDTSKKLKQNIENGIKNVRSAWFNRDKERRNARINTQVDTGANHFYKVLTTHFNAFPSLSRKEYSLGKP